MSKAITRHPSIARNYILEKYEPIPESGCWLFINSLNEKGYAHIGKTKAHRAAYESFIGPIPEGLCVLHKCDVPCCVNPDHLWIGTIAENNQDMANKGRWKNQHAGKTHCPQGHEYSESNTYHYAGRSGRHCKICVRLRDAMR